MLSFPRSISPPAAASDKPSGSPSKKKKCIFGGSPEFEVPYVILNLKGLVLIPDVSLPEGQSFEDLLQEAFILSGFLLHCMVAMGTCPFVFGKGESHLQTLFVGFPCWLLHF